MGEVLSSYKSMAATFLNYFYLQILQLITRPDNFIARRNLLLTNGNIREPTSEGMQSITEAELENCVHHFLVLNSKSTAVDEVQEPVVLCLGMTNSEAESSDSNTAKGDLVSLICICRNVRNKYCKMNELKIYKNKTTVI